MKIAFIYDAAYPWITGGAEIRVYEFAYRLAQMGHEVHWYTMGWWWTEKNKEDLFQDGIYYHGVCPPMDIYSGNRRSIKEAIYYALRLFSPLMKEKYDIIDCQGFPFFSCFTTKMHTILGKSKMSITLLEVWGKYWYDYLGAMGIFGRLVEWIMVRLSSNLISISEKTKRDLLTIHPKAEVTIIPPGINYQYIKSIKPSSDSYQIIYAGRLIKEKQVDLLLKAINNLPDHVKCIIIGSGPEEERLKELANELELYDRVKFEGFITNRKKLLAIFKSAKLLVLPSRREGFGMVVVEANACGIPAIVVDGPQNASVDLINPGENGFISQNDPINLAQKIMCALEKSDSMKENCKRYAQNYDWDVLVQNLQSFYEKVLRDDGG